MTTHDRADDDTAGTDAGSSTDQHVTGYPESGTPLTDQAPTATTPSHGSSNAGINATGANRADGDEPES
ncbi:hypothetical protein [Couchioplanes azureus]|uniref:hypothetical protein n=1 Tax=Couchioplanes caeruleus TaxID=56438 RepID=UPI0016704559|nr:hypothetical protein [Couchioplanes caeruleus]GGQ87678.1 hypothetical protein GCM10010166_67300 [Couchioplanes caeruleus subsp. azureus]